MHPAKQSRPQPKKPTSESYEGLHTSPVFDSTVKQPQIAVTIFLEMWPRCKSVKFELDTNKVCLPADQTTNPVTQQKKKSLREGLSLWEDEENRTKGLTAFKIRHRDFYSKQNKQTNERKGFIFSGCGEAEGDTFLYKSISANKSAVNAQTKVKCWLS